MDKKLKASVSQFRAAAELGARLRSFREDHDFSQAHVARRLGITREKYANFETGRTPLSCEIALRFCLIFVVSEKWLATGEGPRRRLMNLGQDDRDISIGELTHPFEEGIRMLGPLLFLGVWRNDLAKRYDELTAVHPYGIRLPRLGAPILYDDVLLVYLEMWDYWHRRSAEGEQLIRALIEAGNREVAAWGLKEPWDSTIEDIRLDHEQQGLTICSGDVLNAHIGKRSAKADKHSGSRPRKK